VISEFRYLGSYITRDGTDTKDVRARINSAARAFGELSKCIFQSRHVERDAKRAVYERLILSICLYGCESWCLKETLYKELRQFHARCVRTMSRTNLHHTWIHYISTKNSEKELGLDSMNNYMGHCPTSITMASARKSYAFRSSSQTHDALFMAPLLKMQRCRKDDRWQNDWRCPRGQRDSRWHPACLQCDRSPGRRDEDTLLREVDLRQLVEKAQLSVELDTMCLESAFELQAGTSAHTKRSLIE